MNMQMKCEVRATGKQKLHLFIFSFHATWLIKYHCKNDVSQLIKMVTNGVREKDLACRWYFQQFFFSNVITILVWWWWQFTNYKFSNYDIVARWLPHQNDFIDVISLMFVVCVEFSGFVRTKNCKFQINTTFQKQYSKQAIMQVLQINMKMFSILRMFMTFANTHFPLVWHVLNWQWFSSEILSFAS